MIGKVIVLLALTLACVYFVVLTVLFLGLFRTKKSNNGAYASQHELTFVSVIVAARNEQENLAQCLKHLLSQSYVENLYEVIVVDDNSTDNTFSIAQAFTKEDKRFKILKTIRDQKSITGKQYALDAGIRASKGEIILTIDADCEAPSSWIKDIVREFEPDVGLVAGYSFFKEDIYNQGIFQKIFIKLQFLEQLSLYTVSIGSISQGIAWTCTGNNLAYRRKLYDELGGFENLGMTGLEDNMLIQWVGKHSNWRIKASHHSIVYTRPKETVSGFLSQRNRWASSSMQYRLSLLVFMFVTYLLNLAVPLLIAFAIFGIVPYKELIGILSLKIGSEFLLVLKGLTLFDKVGLIKYFPLILPFHVMYVLICGAHGLSSGSFVWKGREYRKKHRA